jgi:hypothetical protein
MQDNDLHGIKSINCLPFLSFLQNESSPLIVRKLFFVIFSSLLINLIVSDLAARQQYTSKRRVPDQKSLRSILQHHQILKNWEIVVRFMNLEIFVWVQDPLGPSDRND